MCNIRRLFYLGCFHSTEHHISNCSNHRRCPAQKAWSGHSSLTIVIRDECPPCRLETRKSDMFGNMLTEMSLTGSAREKELIRRQHETEALELESQNPGLELPFNQYKEPGWLHFTPFIKEKTKLSQVMTPENCQESDSNNDERTPNPPERSQSRQFDISVMDDEEVEEDHEVAADGALAAGDELEMEGAIWEDVDLSDRQQDHPMGREGDATQQDMIVEGAAGEEAQSTSANIQMPLRDTQSGNGDEDGSTNVGGAGEEAQSTGSTQMALGEKQPDNGNEEGSTDAEDAESHIVHTIPHSLSTRHHSIFREEDNAPMEDDEADRSDNDDAQSEQSRMDAVRKAATIEFWRKVDSGEVMDEGTPYQRY